MQLHIHSVVSSIALRDSFIKGLFCIHLLRQTFLTTTAAKGILGGRITPTSELASKVPGRLWHGLCSLFDSSAKRSTSESQEDITNIENIEFVDTSDEDDVFENTYANMDYLKQPAKPEPIYATVKKRPKQSPKVEDTERNITVGQKKVSPAEGKPKVAAASSSSGGVKQPPQQETPQLPAAEVADPESEEGMEAMRGLSTVMVPFPVFLVLTPRNLFPCQL